MILAAFCSSPNAATLVGHWKFDEGSGTVTNDASGNGNNGTLVNGAAWAVGKQGNALSFDGINSYVRIPDSPILRIPGPFTIMLWLKPSSLDQGFRSFVNKYNNYLFQTANQSPNTGRLRVTFSGHALESPDYTLTLGEWQHIAAVWDGIYLKLYKNGTQVADSWEGPATPTAQASYLYIGCENGSSQYFNGLIDEVKIYNGALTAAEIVSECGGGGDANGDGKVNVGDAVYLINYVFKGGLPPVCK